MNLAIACSFINHVLFYYPYYLKYLHMIDLNVKNLFSRQLGGVAKQLLNHFSTIGLYGGPAHYDVSIRQAAIEAFVTSSF